MRLERDCQVNTAPVEAVDVQAPVPLVLPLLVLLLAVSGACLLLPQFSSGETVESSVEVPMKVCGAYLPNGLEGKADSFDYCVSLCFAQLAEKEHVDALLAEYDTVLGQDRDWLVYLGEQVMAADTFAALELESARISAFEEVLSDRKIAEAIKAEEERKAREAEEMRIAEEERAAAEAAAAAAEAEAAAQAAAEEEYEEEAPSYPYNEGGALTPSKGVVFFEGHKETYYSQRVLPGGGLNIPGRHVASDGTIRDADDYICVAADPSYMPYGSTLETSLGPAKVYDCGCAYGTIDIYTDW